MQTEPNMNATNPLDHTWSKHAPLLCCPVNGCLPLGLCGLTVGSTALPNMTGIGTTGWTDSPGYTPDRMPMHLSWLSRPQTQTQKKTN